MPERRRGDQKFVVDGANLYRIQNDVTGVVYADTADRVAGKKTVPSGVLVKYYPPGGSDQIGRFKMAIDQTGFLQRFVRLLFLEPSTGDGQDARRQSKWVLFGISFNPVGTFSDRSYMLGIFAAQEGDIKEA